MIVLFYYYYLNSMFKKQTVALMPSKIKNEQYDFSYDMRATNTGIGDTRFF